MDHTQSHSNPQIVDEASAWLIEFSDGAVDLQGRTEFVRWLKASPEHVRAYLRLSQLWDESSFLAARLPPEGRAILSEAAARDNVIIARSVPPKPTSPGEPISPAAAATPVLATRSRKARRFLPLAVGLAIVCTTFASLAWYNLRRGVYTTDIGEQRTIHLQDGSVVELNTASRIRVSFTGERRDVTLLAGQALFHVAKDAARPFIVACGAATVRAVGTQFDVYKRGVGATVTVLEGKVAVSELGGPPGPTASLPDSGNAASSDPLLLSAGEQVAIGPRAVTRVPASRAALARATAWTQRRLVFESASLDEVIADFNRYNTRALVITAPALRKFHISGDFPAFDPEQLVQFMQDRFDVAVVETDREIRISPK